MKMNLTKERWIPVLLAKGEKRLCSLDEIFDEGDQMKDLAVRPHERVALMRLLICITQAALDGPEDEEEWEECRPKLKEAVGRYLDRWQAAFELLGDGPRFLQLPNLATAKDAEPIGASKLDLVLASGNNATLFDNAAGGKRRVLRERLPLTLLGFQCFSPCGLIGIAKWNGKDTPREGKSGHAPCVPSSMVHTFVLGSNLLETIHANLLTKEQITDAVGRWGKPIWEQPVTKAEDTEAVENATLTYLGRLLPLCRAIRLNDDMESMILANGLTYPTFPSFRETTATLIKDKKGLALLPGSTQRSLWRQLGAISVKRRFHADAPSGPLALSHRINDREMKLWVGAFATKQGKPGKIDDLIEASYSVPKGLLDDAGRAAYERGVGAAEEIESCLGQAVKSYASSLKSTPQYKAARQYYWTRVEQHVGLLFDFAANPDLAADPQSTPWGKALNAAALHAFQRSCPRETPRQIEAFVQGMARLRGASKRKQPTQQT
jgi:CRISPR system Cascade subunit CasA